MTAPCSCGVRRANAPLRRSGYQMPHGQERVQHGAARALQQPVLQLRLEAGRVRPSEHRELGLEQEIAERAGVEQLAEGAGEEHRVLVHPEDADAARVVHVLVEDRVQPRRLERAHERLGVRQPPKACSCMNSRRSECWLAPRSRTSTRSSSALLTSASPRVHFEMRVLTELADRDQRLACRAAPDAPRRRGHAAPATSAGSAP